MHSQHHCSRLAATSSARTVAFFDLDKTIIATSSAYAYGKEFMNSGLISPLTALHLYVSKATYMFAGHSSEQMDASRDQLSHMVTGWDVDTITSIATESVHSVLIPAIYSEARDLINQHHKQGHDVVIISASARILVEPIAQELGVDSVIATELEQEDGKLTGNITFYCKGPAKAEAILALAREKNYDLDHSFAYSDSITDLPMLEAVAHPVAVNPDRALRRLATRRGWDICFFQNPVPLITLPSSKEIGIGTGVVAAIATVSAGLWWWLRRTGSPTPAVTVPQLLSLRLPKHPRS